MIALLAAVAPETERLRSVLKATAEGCWSGRIAGREVVLVHTGVGKASAAASCTEILLRQRPSAAILFGCGGAYPDSGLRIGDLALASEEFFGDEGCQTPDGFLDLEQLQLPSFQSRGRALFNRMPLDPSLCEYAGKTLQDLGRHPGHILERGRFITVSTCSGTAASGAEIAVRTGGICENMEGAAVALACCRQEVPLVEIRGISNLVEDRQRGNWNLPAAIAVAQTAVFRLLDNWPDEFGA